MDIISGVTQILGNGFFPIAVCGFLFWYVYKKDAQHKEEIGELRKSIDSNTRVLQKFIDRMEVKNE